MHKKVAEFVGANAEAVIDAAIMDGVLMSEYKAGVEKLIKQDNQGEELKELEEWLTSVVWQMIECASSNIAAGHQIRVYIDFLGVLSNCIKQ